MENSLIQAQQEMNAAFDKLTKADLSVLSTDARKQMQNDIEEMIASLEATKERLKKTV